MEIAWQPYVDAVNLPAVAPCFQAHVNCVSALASGSAQPDRRPMETDDKKRRRRQKMKMSALSLFRICMLCLLTGRDCALSARFVRIHFYAKNGLEPLEIKTAGLRQDCKKDGTMEFLPYIPFRICSVTDWNFRGYRGGLTIALSRKKVSKNVCCIKNNFTQGIMPLVSYNYASRNIPRMKETILFSGKLLTAVMCAIAAVLFLFPGIFVSLFMENQEVVACGARMLRGYALALPFLRMDFFTVGIFQAVGMVRETFFFAVARKLLLEIPALFILDHFFPLFGLSYAQLAAEVVMAAVSLVMLRKLFRTLNQRFQVHR